MKIFYKKTAKLIIILLLILVLLLSIYYLILYFKLYFKYNIKSDIYEITKPGEPKSYLVSGFHVMEKNDILPDRIKNKIPNIDLLITEIYLNESDKDYYKKIKLNEFTKLAFNNGIKSNLNNKLGDDLVIKIKDFFNKKAIIPKDMQYIYEYIQPWYIYMSIQTAMLPSNFQLKKGYDILLTQEALKNNKKISYFEDLMTVYKYYSSLDVNMIIKSLNIMIDDYQEYEERIQNLYYYFKHQQYNKIYIKSLHFFDFFNTLQLILYYKEYKYFLKFTNNLINNRNKKWIPIILDTLPKNKTMIVVGFLHLYGLKKDLIKHGYKLKPVFN